MSTVMDVPTCAVNGTKLEYVDQGKGSAVVFVHGGLSDHRTWAAQVAPVAKRHRAIAFSGRYHWPNDPVPAGTESTMGIAVADLVGFLDAVGAAPAHLVGNSWGAFVCLRVAILRPDLVRSLTLCEPPVLPLFVGNPPRSGEIVRMLATRPRTGLTILGFGARTIGPVQKLLRAGRDDEAMERFVRGVVGNRDFEAIPIARKEQMRQNLAEFHAQLLSPGSFDPLTADEVRRVRVPTLLATGARSPAVLLRLTDALERLLPDRRRVEIPDASHIMHEQNAPAFNAVLLSFLAERDEGMRAPVSVSNEL